MFDDREVREVDLANQLDGRVFEPLRDPAEFARVSVDAETGTVPWPTGADLDPIVIYRGLLRRYVEEMRSGIDALVALVDDLFEFAKLDAGALEAEVECATVAEVVGRALSACDGQALEKGLRIEARIEAASVADCSPHLTRVVQNLVQNAIRHTPADGTVLVSAAHGPAGLLLTVEDDGEGIPSEALKRVFDPFWSGDPSRTGNGSGLGLALAKRIVE